MKPDDSLGWCIGTIDFAWPRDVVVCKMTKTSFDFRNGVECMRSPHNRCQMSRSKNFLSSVAKVACVPRKGYLGVMVFCHGPSGKKIKEFVVPLKPVPLAVAKLPKLSTASVGYIASCFS